MKRNNCLSFFGKLFIAAAITLGISRWTKKQIEKRIRPEGYRIPGREADIPVIHNEPPLSRPKKKTQAKISVSNLPATATVPSWEWVKALNRRGWGDELGYDTRGIERGGTLTLIAEHPDGQVLVRYTTTYANAGCGTNAPNGIVCLIDRNNYRTMTERYKQGEEHSRYSYRGLRGWKNAKPESSELPKAATVPCWQWIEIYNSKLEHDSWGISTGQTVKLLKRVGTDKVLVKLMGNFNACGTCCRSGAKFLLDINDYRSMTARYRARKQAKQKLDNWVNEQLKMDRTANRTA